MIATCSTKKSAHTQNNVHLHFAAGLQYKENLVSFSKRIQSLQSFPRFQSASDIVNSSSFSGFFNVYTKGDLI